MKIITLILALGCVFTFSACNNNTDVNEEIYTEPPALTVKLGTQEATALLGTHSWWHKTENESGEGVVSDYEHPLYRKEYMSVIEGAVTTAALEFEVTPDSITRAICWSDENWDNTSAESEEISVSGNEIELKQGGYIYEIEAEWNSSEDYNGTATYSFYAICR